MVKQNVDLISSANKVLDDVKDNAAVEIAIKQLNALTQQALLAGLLLALFLAVDRGHVDVYKRQGSALPL